jgi:hypothetical protein
MCGAGQRCCDAASLQPDSAAGSLKPQTHLAVQVSVPLSELGAKVLVAHCRVHNRCRISRNPGG